MTISKTKTAGIFILPALFWGFSPTAQAVNCGDPCDATGVTPQFRLIDSNNVNWDIENTGDHFRIAPAGLGSRFEIQNGADAQQLHLNANGNVGIRTGAPQSFNELEIVSNSVGAGGQADVALSPDGPAGDSGRMSVNATGDTMTFGVRNFGTGYKSPFVISLGGENNSLTINGTGRVGVGVSQALINSAASLHVKGSGATSGNILLDSLSTADDWLIDPGSAGLWLRNGSTTGSPAPIKFENGAPVDSLVMASGGNIGMGTNVPTAGLHVEKAGARILSRDTVVGGSQVLMELEKNGTPAFRLTNTGNASSWDFTQRTNQNFTLSKAGSGQFEVQIEPDGDMLVAGSVTANGVMLTSSRAAKTDFAEIKTDEFMKKLAKIEVQEWRYKEADKNDRHISPMAEDFYSLFKFGPSEKHINPNDLASVALVAAKQLQMENKALKVKLEEQALSQKSRNDKLQQRLASLEKLVTNLASADGSLKGNGEKVAMNDK